MQPKIAIYLLWLIWWMTWIVAAAWVNPAIKRAVLTREILDKIVTFAGAALLFGLGTDHYDLVYQFWLPPMGALGWALVAIVVIAFVFCWWARIELGPLWSSRITRRANHHVVDRGPFALVRHPTYLGIVVAALATAAVRGTPAAFLGVVLMTLGLYLKARVEEQFLREELGAQAYDSYAKRVPMLLPFVHWSS